MVDKHDKLPLLESYFHKGIIFITYKNYIINIENIKFNKQIFKIYWYRLLLS